MYLNIDIQVVLSATWVHTENDCLLLSLTWCGNAIVLMFTNEECKSLFMLCFLITFEILCLPYLRSRVQQGDSYLWKTETKWSGISMYLRRILGVSFSFWWLSSCPMGSYLRPSHTRSNHHGPDGSSPPESAGPCGIHPQLLKSLASTIAGPLTSLVLSQLWKWWNTLRL